jgi:hypothetical protein
VVSVDQFRQELRALINRATAHEALDILIKVNFAARFTRASPRSTPAARRCATSCGPVIWYSSKRARVSE